MHFNLKSQLWMFLMILGTVLTTQATAQSSSCNPSEKSDATACCASKEKVAESTSGCSPSNCRGAQTKFGEAKVITTLRGDLIALKVNLETYSTAKFEERAYSVHALVGETDEESLQIIVNEVQIIEDAFSTTLDQSIVAFELPSQKAKQVQYLQTRIQSLQQLL